MVVRIVQYSVVEHSIGVFVCVCVCVALALCLYEVRYIESFNIYPVPGLVCKNEYVVPDGNRAMAYHTIPYRSKHTIPRLKSSATIGYTLFLFFPVASQTERDRGRGI